MEELRPEELEELVQELEGVSGAEEAPLPEVEQLLQDLEPERPMELKVEAVRQLGELTSSSPQIVEALAAASMWDASPKFRRFAAASLLAPAHQAVMEQHPGLLPQHVKNLLREIEDGGLEEAIVEPEAVEEGLDEAPSVRIDALLHALRHDSSVGARATAAERLGQVDESSLEIIEALITARDHDPFHAVREAAAQALRAPVHQEVLQQYPDLMDEEPGKSFKSGIVWNLSWAVVYLLAVVGTSMLALERMVAGGWVGDWELWAAAVVWFGGGALGLVILVRKGHLRAADTLGWAASAPSGRGCWETLILICLLLALAGPLILPVALLIRPRDL